MELTHELAGILIALSGAALVIFANPIRRQIQRSHVHGIEQVEPAMITWLGRGLGCTLFLLGLVTMANSV